MDKELLISICDRLKSEVPSLRWIDAEEGQLEVRERPPVAFPCALVDISYISCKTYTGGRQQVKANVVIRVAFQRVTASSNASAPMPARLSALSRFDTLNAIHKTLQWWNGDGLFNPLRRLRAIPEKRSGDIRVWNMTYETEFMD